jgi:hypothetical protein
MKQQLFILALLSIALHACKKTETPTTTPPLSIEGLWKLDKVIPSKLIGVYANLNNQTFDAVQYFAYTSIITLNNDKTFADKEIDNGITTNYAGTWSLSGTALTLKFKDNTIETFSYDETNKKMTFVDTGTTLTFTNPNTNKEEDIVCDAQYIYIKL